MCTKISIATVLQHLQRWHPHCFNRGAGGQKAGAIRPRITGKVLELPAIVKALANCPRNPLYHILTHRTGPPCSNNGRYRSEEHTSELQSLMRISYAVFCLKKKKQHKT